MLNPLGDLLTTHPIQTGGEIAIKPYRGWQYGRIDNPDRQFGKGLVSTRTQTQSNGPEPFVTRASFDENCYRNERKSIHIALIIGADFCWVKIPNYQLHDSHTRSSITATMPFSKINVSTINPNMVNSQHSPSCMNRNDVIIKYTKHPKETQNLNKKLQIFTHLSTLQSARRIPTHNANSWTTVQPVHSILTRTNLQLDGYLYASNGAKSVQREDSQCDRARVAKPHPHQQHGPARNRQRDQQHSFCWLQGIAAVS